MSSNVGGIVVWMLAIRVIAARTKRESDFLVLYVLRLRKRNGPPKPSKTQKEPKRMLKKRTLSEADIPSKGVDFGFGVTGVFLA